MIYCLRPRARCGRSRHLIHESAAGAADSTGAGLAPGDRPVLEHEVVRATFGCFRVGDDGCAELSTEDVTGVWCPHRVAPAKHRRQQMAGFARVYDHVTPAMNDQVLGALETRWMASVASLTAAEGAQLMRWFPRLRETVRDGDETVTEDRIAISSPSAG